ncbi:MAG TPA: EF-hand domain-containing protein, partial [Rhizomicrobium sp.]
MTTTIRYALLIGAVAIAGIGMAGAGMQKPVPKPQAGFQAGGHGHGRGGQRFLSEYDLNHDGKVTRDEFNKVTAQRFAEATHGAKTMTAAQYEGFRTKNLHQHADQSFRRADWNGDGKLSFDEFANPIRASFARADKQSTGSIFCRPKNGSASAPLKGPRRRGGSRGAGSFCSRDDLNHDGKVTRAELDQALHQQFAGAAKGGAMNKDQFTGMQSSRAQQTSGRTFQR